MVLYLLSKVTQSQKRDVFSIAVLLLSSYCWIFERKEDHLHQKSRSPHTVLDHRTTKTPAEFSSCKLKGGIFLKIYHSISGKSILLLQSKHLWFQWMRGWGIQMSPTAVAEQRQVLDRRLMMRVGLPYLLPCELLVRCSANRKTDELCGKMKRRGTKPLIKTYLQNVFYTKMWF